MQPAGPTIFDDFDTALLEAFSGRARVQPPAARPPRRERPALDSCRLLEIFSPFLLPRQSVMSALTTAKRAGEYSPARFAV